MIKAVLFDLDGTLIDTQNLIVTSFQRAALDVLGVEVSAEQIRPLIGVPLLTQMEEVAPGHVEEMMAAYRAQNVLLHDKLIAYYDGTKELLEQLKAKKVAMAVVTSKRHAPALEGLQSFDLQDYFEFILGMDDYPIHKPRPEPLLEAAMRLGFPNGENCVYVGDSTFDMQAAVAAKMPAIAALWGMFSYEELKAAGAEYFAKKPSDIVGMIDKL